MIETTFSDLSNIFDDKSSEIDPNEPSSESHPLLERIRTLSKPQQQFLSELYGPMKVINPDEFDQIKEILEKDVDTLLSSDNGVFSLNNRRETAFQKLHEKLKSLTTTDPTGKTLEIWLSEAINSIMNNPSNGLQSADFSSAKVAFATSTRVNVLSGVDVERPVITFADREQLIKVHEFLTGITNSIHGAFFPFGTPRSELGTIDQDHQVLADAGLIIAAEGMNETLSHELIHTADPYVSTRRGFDNILTEMMAAFFDKKMDKTNLIRILNHPVYRDISLDEEQKSDQLNEDKGYSKNKRFGQTEKTPELHKQVVEAVVETLFQDIKKMGIIKAIRKIAINPSIDRYLTIRIKIKYES